LLPLAILVYVAIWLFGLIRGAIGPLTKIVMAKSALQGIVADIVTIGLLVCACFLVGAIVRTRLGKWLYALVELRLLRKAPGYSMVKETVSQFLGKKQSPFSSVALVRIFGNDTLASAFVTDTHADGRRTVFVPTGPNPTSGNIYHLKAEDVFPVDVAVEDAMRSIISCGAGSSALIDKLDEDLRRPGLTAVPREQRAASPHETDLTDNGETRP
ncbi:MAG: DUF502 domain-containing protein, partial [Sedimentisphaerales bacterium]|nr:DUF502 domain-containing protein [Sedimentisphaerales bacterium]